MDKKALLKKIPFLVIVAFVLLLPFNFNLLSPIIGLMIGIGLLQFDKDNAIQNIRVYKHYFMFFILFLVWQSITLIWTDDISNGLKAIEHKAFFIVAPLLFIVSQKWKFDKIIQLFVISNLILCILCFGYLILFFINEKMYFIDKTINNGVNLGTIRYITYHGGVNFIFFGVHRLYFSFSILTCLLFLVFCKNVLTSRLIKYATSLIFIFVIFLLQSKISAILVLILLFYSAYHKFVSGSKNIRVLILSGLVVILGIGFYLTKTRFNQSIDQLTEISENKKGSLIERYQYNRCSFELIKEAPFFGHGVGDIDQKMKGKLTQNSYTFLLERGVYDPHNEFLKAFVGMGVIGFLLFISIFIAILYNAYRQKNKILFFYVGFVFIICLIEPFLSRQAGILPALFFIGLLTYKNQISENV